VSVEKNTSGIFKSWGGGREDRVGKKRRGGCFFRMAWEKEWTDRGKKQGEGGEGEEEGRA